ncbi:MAG: aldehyde dehydrogenase family protein, partial [Nitrospirae bacterium]|nr:aldehyde dehydrogenase family protein [Nitrospirota bacterium]
MADYFIPDNVTNWINGMEVRAVKGEEFLKLSPMTGRPICRVARSRSEDVHAAVEAARRSQPAWAAETVVHRGDLLRAAALALREHQKEFAKIVSDETGKSVKDALMETNAAVEMGLFVAGEGRRFYGKTTTSATPNKAAMIVRQP